MIERISALLFLNRKTAIALFALLTLVFAFFATQLQIDVGSEKRFPLKHPYMQTFTEYQSDFGGANRLLIALKARDGDIYQAEFLQTLKEVTDEVFFLPGVDRGTVTSIFTPNTRFIEIVEGGFAGGNVVPADFLPDPENIEIVRQNVLKSGIVGRLVANDFSAAIISAQLVERDPVTKETLDYIAVSQEIEEKIRSKYENESISVHVIGFAKAVGEIAEGARGVLAFFGIAFFITALIVRIYVGSWRLTVLPLFCSIITVVWNLGLLTLLGFGIDPMSILVPFLVFAIAISHGVQVTSVALAEMRTGKDSRSAARTSFERLALPGCIALLSDAAGFLTLFVIEIQIIQELALTACLGVLAVILTNLTLLPLLISFGSGESISGKDSVATKWEWLSLFAERKLAVLTILFAIGLFVFGYVEGRGIQIGDAEPGLPELHYDARYNVDSRAVTDAFSIGVDILTVVVETVPNGCIEHDVMSKIDRFQWLVSNVEGVQSTISLPQVAKRINAGWNEGNPKWRSLPRNSDTMVQSVSSVETATGLLNADCSAMPVLVFLGDHKVETINRVVETIESFATQNNSDRHRFRLATGNVGGMAATNQVVDAAQFKMLIYVYGAVFILCFVTFRSISAVICICAPLCVVSVLTYALMSWLGIGLKVSTLPVTVLGVGVGVDYGIYVFSRLQSFLKQGLSLPDAYKNTLRTTGAAVATTGITLAIGTCTWIWSDLKFQADMGLLLTFMFLANMVGALTLLPALAACLGVGSAKFEKGSK